VDGVHAKCDRSVSYFGPYQLSAWPERKQKNNQTRTHILVFCAFFCVKAPSPFFLPKLATSYYFLCSYLCSLLRLSCLLLHFQPLSLFSPSFVFIYATKNCLSCQKLLAVLFLFARLLAVHLCPFLSLLLSSPLLSTHHRPVGCVLHSWSSTHETPSVCVCVCV
jgi:hypothetical protein